MNIVDCNQGDSAWFQCRLGVVTSSRVADIVAKRKRVKDGVKPEELACRRDMRYELLLENLTGKPTEHYVSRWMKEGKEKEPIARVEYELFADTSVEQVGFVYHDRIKMAGCSPDGLVGDSGLIEIKCPALNTHLEYLIADAIPEEYQPQMLWQMACTDRQWCDFVSFHPDMPEHLQLFVKRMERDEGLIRGYELEVEYFLAEVDSQLAKLKESNRLATV